MDIGEGTSSDTDNPASSLLHNRKSMAHNKTTIEEDVTALETFQEASEIDDQPRTHAYNAKISRHITWHRNRYAGALLYNFASFLLPALYGTLSKLWIANINSALVVTTDSYTYIGVVAEVLNEGLPRAAWVVIGDRESRSFSSRIKLANTLIAFQVTAGLILSIIICAGAATFAGAFVPGTVRSASLIYVRISAWECLTSALETAIASATRSLDKPDVPLIISSAKFAINITLDLLFLSWFRPTHFNINVNTQAYIRQACDASSAAAGLVYFLYTTTQDRRKLQAQTSLHESVRPSVKSLAVLIRPGVMTFTESAVRNALYLWLVSGIIALGAEFATAWGVFNTIRWGLVMVPVQTLEATSLAFTGHAWGEWRHRIGVDARRAKASLQDIFGITRPALTSVALALSVEVPICIFLTLFGCRPFAFWLSGSDSVATITAYMWRTIDWCYVFYAMNTQFATILLATRPQYYLYQSFISNICYVLPWAVVCQVIKFNVEDAWKYYRIGFGGSLVFSFIDVAGVLMVWAWFLLSGKARLEAWRSAD